MEKIKVVCIGGQGHSVMVFDDMVGMPEAELVAVAPAFPEENLDLVTRHPLCTSRIPRFDDYRDMLRRLKPDVAIVSPRLDLITPISIDAADAGCHVIAEKPLALNHESLKQLYQTVQKNHVALTAMLTMRAQPAFIAARNSYQQGDIGEVVLVNGRKSYRWLGPPDWFADRKTYGGTIGWVGIHALDVLNYITQEGYTSVAAMQSNFGHAGYDGCEDNCVLIFEMTNGGHGTVSVDYFRPVTAATHGDDWVRVVGTKGILEANASEGFCRLLVEGKKPMSVPLPSPGLFFGKFLLSLSGNGHYDAKPADSFMLTHVCLCARDAADQKCVVNIKQDLWQ